jgi:DnaK suppressor protein
MPPWLALSPQVSPKVVDVLDMLQSEKDRSPLLSKSDPRIRHDSPCDIATQPEAIKHADTWSGKGKEHTMALDLVHIKERLITKEQEIQHHLAFFARESTPTKDPEQGGQDWEETALDFQTSQQDPLIQGDEQQLLADVQHALQRLDQGTYGLCVVCGQPIPEKRLEALPWTSRCIKDEEQLEQRIESQTVLRDYPY